MMGTVNDDEMKMNFDEETQRLMKAANESLERLRSFTARWCAWYEEHKALFANVGCQVPVINLLEEREATTTVIDVVEQLILFESINSITCEEGSGQHFAGIAYK